MYHYLKYFLTPTVTVATFAGVFLGGNFMWLGIGIFTLLLIGGDYLLGEDISKPDYKYPALLSLPLLIALPLLTATLAALAWASGAPGTDLLGIGALLERLFAYDFLAARSANTGLGYCGGLLSVAFVIAGYGTNVAHELTHQTQSRWKMILGRWLLSMSCNADFSIEHVYGHHVTVGTREDPATARRGESVYAFSLRSTVLGHLNAWRLELERLRKRGYGVFSRRNRMLTGYLMSLVWIGLFAHAGGMSGVGFFLAQAVVAKFLLEIVNYMEHYGLVRDPSDPVLPRHSWNTNKRMSGITLYTLTRHSAHHERGSLPFWKLDPYPEAPQMPQGYLTTIVICLIPPLWYRVMSARLDDWDAAYATG